MPVNDDRPQPNNAPRSRRTPRTAAPRVRMAGGDVAPARVPRDSHTRQQAPRERAGSSSAQRASGSSPRRGAQVPVPRETRPRPAGRRSAGTAASASYGHPSSTTARPRARASAPVSRWDNVDTTRLVWLGIRGLFVVAAVIVAVIAYFLMPITIHVDGKELSMSRGTTYQALLDEGYLTAKPGNLVAVDGSLLEEGGGNVPTVYNDDEQVATVALVSESGNITAKDGEDAVEQYTVEEERTPVETRVAKDKEAAALGANANEFNFYNGVLHVVTDQGAEGVTEKRTGEISGKTETVEAQAMKPRTIENIHSTLPNDRKLIALTFDDGPSPNENETQAVLDVLAKYRVKATFFMLGSEAEQYPEMAKKVVAAGHQAASHSYSHAAEHYLSKTTEDDVRSQLTKAREAIGAAVGYEPSLVRPPGGNVNIKAIQAAGTLADGYIGWSVDPHDYDKPGANVIAQAIIDQAAPGAIVLLHDGGGDRSQTVEAIDKAIPALQASGYSFATIDELVDAVLQNRGEPETAQP